MLIRLQFHPNIYPDGTLCMDLIQDNWSPIYSVCSILIAIRSLLTDPNCKLCHHQ